MAEKNRTNSRSAKKDQVRLAIRQKVEDDLAPLQSQGLSIQSAYISGSQVGGRTDQWSDIDLCVVSIKKSGFSRGVDASRRWPNVVEHEFERACLIGELSQSPDRLGSIR